MKIDELKNTLVKLHAWTCKEGTNNSVFYNASAAIMNDQKFVFYAELKKSLGIPSLYKFIL